MPATRGPTRSPTICPHALQHHIPRGNEATCRQATAVIMPIYNTVRFLRPEAQLLIDDQALAAFCERYHIRRLAFFGSVLGSDFRPDSDVDILVKFEPGHVPDFPFAGLQDELSQMIGRTVDLHTPGSLSRQFREKVQHDAQVQCAA